MTIYLYMCVFFQDTLREDCAEEAVCPSQNCCVNPLIAPVFFVIFVLMAQFVLVNVVVAVLMKHLEVCTICRVILEIWLIYCSIYLCVKLINVYIYGCIQCHVRVHESRSESEYRYMSICVYISAENYFNFVKETLSTN